MVGNSTPPRVDYSKLNHWLLRATDVGLLAVIFIAPLFMGGRHPVGALVYVALVSLTAICWFARQCLSPRESYHFSWADCWLAAGFLLLVFQLVSLPETWLEHVSPGASELLQPGSWSHLSLTPEATRGSLVLFLAHAMLFIVVVQRCKEISDVERLLRLVALAACAMAVLGLAQFLFGNGKFVWVYSHPSRDTWKAAKGAFSNENHFAHFLALGIGPLIWMLVGTQSDASDRRKGEMRLESLWHRYGGFLTSIAIGVVIFAGLLSFSRGGVIVMLFAMLVGCGIFAWQSLISMRSIATFSAIGAIAVVAISIHGYERLTGQLKTISGDLDQLDTQASRRTLWQANVAAFTHFPYFGTGGGSHRDVYKVYFDVDYDKEYTHGESGYIQVLSEYGVAGVILLVTAVAAIGYWCIRSLRASSSVRCQCCLIAVVTGLLTSAVHSVWDFVWYIPSCISIATILAAMACRLHSIVACETMDDAVHPSEFLVGRLRPMPTPRWIWTLATVLLVATSFYVIRQQLGPALASGYWDRYIAESHAINEHSEELPQKKATNDQLLRLLVKILERNPADGRAHLKMAVLCLQRFNMVQQSSPNPLPFTAIHDAIVASNFPSTKARDDWLAVAVGENLQRLNQARHHAQAAIRLSPLEGEGYLILAEVAFLSDQLDSAVQKRRLIEQALKVRPYHGAILAAAGTDAARVGDTDRAIAFWKQAFHKDKQQQLRLIEQLAPHTPASFFLTQFEAKLGGLRALYAYYAREQRAAEEAEIGRSLAHELVEQAKIAEDQDAPPLWHEAYRVLKDLGDAKSSLICLERANQLSPGDYSIRRTLAFELAEQDHFDKAIAHFQWCLYRKPDDEYLKSQMSSAHRKKLESHSLTESKTDNELRKK